jgi:hypothetical protein
MNQPRSEHITELGDWRGERLARLRQLIHLADPHQLFNNGLDSKKHRSIDFYPGDSINEPALLELIRTAVALNLP